MFLLLIVAAFGSPQDPPKVTYEDSGEFRLLALDLEQRFKGRLKFAEKVPKKEISISVRDAGYFQALDALCRAHKNVTYFPLDEMKSDQDRLTLYPGPWVEHPASYEGHFKIALVSLTRTIRSTPSGEQARVEVEVSLFSPPWIPRDSIGWVTWNVEEAVAADGRAVRDVGHDPSHGQGRLTHAGQSVNVLPLLDFNLSRELKSFSGKAIVQHTPVRPTRLVVAKGSSVRIPLGQLVVESIAEIEEGWRIVVRFEPRENSPTPHQAVGPTFHYESGPAEGAELKFPHRGRTFDIRIPDLSFAPGWIDFMARAEPREIEIPFRFKDVLFRKE